MPTRTTQMELESQASTLNRLAGFDDNEPLWQREGNENKATVGMFYIDAAYGGVTLKRIVSDSGGVTDVFRSGHMPKRELADRMRAYMDGIEFGYEEGR
jgi:hypothetical protein